tara:strand:+ start:6111 stop:6344 length:234 start_codon:yes stop_codon:yes gene_type:complete
MAKKNNNNKKKISPIKPPKSRRGENETNKIHKKEKEEKIKAIVIPEVGVAKKLVNDKKYRKNLFEGIIAGATFGGLF